MADFDSQLEGSDGGENSLANKAYFVAQAVIDRECGVRENLRESGA